MNLLPLIEKLTPKNVHSNKFRLGPNRDGGYIINDLIAQHTKKLITIGYGNSEGFEVEWYEKYNTPIDIYDGTCDCDYICTKFANDIGSKINYYKQNVGYEKENVSVNNILQNETNVLLKVDIEGSEYDAFRNTDLSNVTGVLLEVHALHYEPHQVKFIELMNTEFNHFELFHIHANNHGGSFRAKASIIPTTYELSLVNKQLVTNISDDASIYPINGLDFANDGSDVDMPITNEFNKYTSIHQLFTPISSFS